MSRVSAEQRREDFVNAAVRVIADHGGPGATTRLIAEAADAPLASLHYCYSSKEALFDVVFEALAHRPFEWMEESTDEGLADAAAATLTRAVEWYVQRPDWARARLELGFWAVHAGGDLATRAYDQQSKAIETILRRACGKRDDPELVESASHLVIAMLDGLLLQWMSRADDAALRNQLARSAEALSAMLRRGRRSS